MCRADIKIRLLELSTVVGDYTNTMKRIFSLNFDTQMNGKQEKLLIRKASLFVRKKLYLQ